MKALKMKSEFEGLIFSRISPELGCTIIADTTRINPAEYAKYQRWFPFLFEEMEMPSENENKNKKKKNDKPTLD